MLKAVVALGLVVAVCAGALLVAGTRGPGDPAAAVERMRALLGGAIEAELRPADLSAAPGAACARDGIVVELASGAACTLAVARGGARVRKGRLVAAGRPVCARFDPAPSEDPRPAPGPTGLLRPGEALALDVYREGGSIALACRPTPGCEPPPGATGSCALRIAPR